ncbi:MAG: U32 family peptidase [Clostridia bacterium]|nr:U32 family peptidase [Clostridia bacterium]
MDNRFELLAPAGSYEAFLAAVENGADAVYMGGKLFNARANASNFDLEELSKIVQYAHLRNVKIYITLNTLLNDQEMKEALDFAYSIYEIGVDAVIVQDLGLASVLHKHIPNLALHASTQMTVYDLEGVNELEKLGFTRVVLARELSMEEIKYICENTKLEIEVFVHGALCVCYSGECLMSSMIGDRSGNRGKCAQPCRMPYHLLEDGKEVGDGYLLSPKDLSSIDLLKNFPNVTSLKIEGRMKSPEYVATVVSNYRKYLDNGYALSEDKEDLKQIFNRGGFTTAYLEEKQGADMMCYEKPKNWGVYVGKVTNYDGRKFITLDHVSNLHIGDGIEVWNGKNESPSTIISEISGNKVGRISGKINIGDKVYKTSDKRLNQSARESFSRGFVKKADVKVHVEVKENRPVKMKIEDMEYVSEIIPQVAQKQPLTRETLCTQLGKTGNTPFRIKELTAEMDNNLFLTIGEINEIRREAFAKWEETLLAKIPRTIARQRLEVPQNREIGAKKVSLYILNLRREHLQIKLNEVDRVYFSFKDALKNTSLIEEFQCEKYIVFPIVTKANYDRLIRKNIVNLAKMVDGFVISNLGQLAYLKDIKTKKIANETLNIFNSYTAQMLERLGFDEITLSPELTREQINGIKSCLPCEYKVYGRQRVMTSEYCPVGSVAGGFSASQKCSMPCLNGKRYVLKDRVEAEFPLSPDNVDCQCEIYNSKITSVASRDLKVDSIRIDVQGEEPSKINNIISIHKMGEKLSGNQYTNGHIARPV